MVGELQLAGSDANKDAIVQSGGLTKIINLMNTYSEEPSVLQEVISLPTHFSDSSVF